MSRRPIRDKQMRKLKRSLTMPLYSQIDLVHWLKSRGHAQTTGAARTMLEDGKVRNGSHVIGRTRVIKTDALGKPVVDDEGRPELAWAASPLVPASLRSKLIVI